mmetsp:Transcript_13358/g.23453  ORF Transcript_13358/g.23453 Transcript_13358/m.23453 type:complete len:201 (-) Transcript_13358:1534-2136(-)
MLPFHYAHPNECSQSHHPQYHQEANSNPLTNPALPAPTNTSTSGCIPLWHWQYIVPFVPPSHPLHRHWHVFQNSSPCRHRLSSLISRRRDRPYIHLRQSNTIRHTTPTRRRGLPLWNSILHRLAAIPPRYKWTVNEAAIGGNWSRESICPVLLGTVRRYPILPAHLACRRRLRARSVRSRNHHAFLDSHRPWTQRRHPPR